MKKRYQIEKQRAVQRFRKLAAQDDQPIQLVIPLQEILDLVQRGLMNLAMAAFTKLAECVMGHEVTALVGEKNHANPARAATRWGSEPGYCVVGGQKIPLQRPRVRDTRKREVPLGSYELLQRASLMEESVYQKIMHGITTRGYSAVIKELEAAYGIKKSTISEHFIEASRQRLDKLLARPLRDHALCAMMIDGTHFDGQQLITVLGITVHGQKLVLGLRQGATENASVVKQLLDDMRDRGVDFEVPRLYVLDGGRRSPRPCAAWPARADSFNAARCTRSATSSRICPKNTLAMCGRSCTARMPCATTWTRNARWRVCCAS